MINVSWSGMGDNRTERDEPEAQVTIERGMEMKTATIQVETLTCPSCVQKIEAAVKGVEGVDPDTVKVLFNSSKVKVDFDEEKVPVSQIAEAITKVGYEVLKSSAR